MDTIFPLILLIAFISGLIFYKGAIKKTAQYTEDIVTTNIAESNPELIKRANKAYEKLIEECGEDYMTPQQVYDMMMKTRKKVVKKQS